MQRIKKRLASLVFLVHPLLLTFIGVVFLSLSAASVIVWFYRTADVPPIFTYLTLQFLPGLVRSIILGVIGLVTVILGIWHLSGIAVIRLHGNAEPGSEVVLGYQHSQKPPRVVVFSGGPGMLMLSNLGKNVERLTCVTPIQDPVEYYYRASSLYDIQNVYYVVPTPIPAKVYAELDDGTIINVMRVNPDPTFAERYVERLMLVTEEEIDAQPHGDNNGNQAATYAAQAASQAAHASQASHTSTPQTSLAPVTKSLPLTRLAKETLHDADVIILGPGSIFESIVPNLLIDEVREAIRQSKALKVYICNLMTEPGLTTGFGVREHIREINRYGGFTPDYVLVNIQRIDPEVRGLYAAMGQVPVYLSPEEYEEIMVVSSDGTPQRRVLVEGSVVMESDLASAVIQYSASLDNPGERRAVHVLRHDPQKLATAILELLRRE